MALRKKDLPLEKEAVGVYTPIGIIFVCIKMTVPLAYLYILLVLLRELCQSFPATVHIPIEKYVPLLASIILRMEKSSIFMEVWAVIEALFYIFLKLNIHWMQASDPLEASLSSAPMMELGERQSLWDKMMESLSDEPVSFITGWFFDQELHDISKYDILDFVAWSMFEARNQEHLTHDELRQLDTFVEDYEWRLSIYLHGLSDESLINKPTESGSLNKLNQESHYTVLTKVGENFVSSKNHMATHTSCSSLESLVSSTSIHPIVEERPCPHKWFRFRESSHDNPPTFFTNLYENYKRRYEQYRQMLENPNFHPVQDFRNFMAEKKQQIYEAEENAMATASHMYENAYFTFVNKGSNFDKQITAISQSTYEQLTEVWNSMWEMKGRLGTANFISSRRKALNQQMKGYRRLLTQMVSMSSAVPSKQMADLMRKITQCNEALERIECSARDAFITATGFASKNLPQREEPKRYAKYSSDPLLNVTTYPLMLHLLILSITDGGLQILMKKRGFERKRIGQINYYYHPGLASSNLADDQDDTIDAAPIVFCHGIGIGLIIYLPLIDELLKLGRPVFLPEIPYVSGFRPWQSQYSVLPPAAVVSTLTAMLASNGYLHGVFTGHSYGTSWLSYMCKYAPNAIAAVLFLDPICFCLHHAYLTKQFVYHRPDPGMITYMIRTDAMINWTIQRSFPWTRVSLFVEQIPDIPCSVFLSDRDALVPAERAERYFRSKGAPVLDFSDVDKEHFTKGPINVTVFRGDRHGDWVERSCTAVRIAEAVEVICSQVRKESRKCR